MQIKSTEIVAASLLQQLDSRTWEAVALKAIDKMPKHKLQRESHRMFNDFVFMSSNSNPNNKSNLPQQIDNIRNIHETLLIGSTKIADPSQRRRSTTEVQEIISQIPRQTAFKKIRNRQSDIQSLKTQQSQDDKKTENDKKSNDQGCLKLFVSELAVDKEANEKMEKIEEGLRSAQLENLKYSTRVMQLERERQAASQQRTQAQRKKYKELKAFTYDYEGKLMGSAHKNTGNIKVLSIKTYFNNLKAQKHAQPKVDSTKMSPITKKKVIGNTQEKAQQVRQSKIGRFMKAEVTRTMTELFRDDKSVQMGVSITDMHSHSKLIGKDRDRSDKKNYNLEEFKNHSKLIDGFKPRTSMILVKQKPKRQENIVPASPQPRERIRTQIQSEAESKLFSSNYSRFGRNRGSISINNQKLYTETFHDVY